MNRELSHLKVLVIGGAGYIGSHTVKLLKEYGAHVTVLDNLSTGKQYLLQGDDFIEGDLGDKDLTSLIFKKYKFDAVMHFAAFSIVGESVVLPLKYYENNVAKTASFLEVMIEHNVKKFIFSSTAAVYGEPMRTPITEDHPCNPKNPYGRSKAMVENIMSDSLAADGLQYAALRYFNAAGADPCAMIGEAHEPETHLIPIVLEVAAGRREEVKIYGANYNTPDGTCIRDYIHVNDLAEAHILALNALIDGKDCCIYNLGSGQGYSVRQVIEVAREVTGHMIPVTEERPRAGDPAVLVASSAKIRKELGWQPKYDDLKVIIETAWKWHKNDRKAGR